MVARADNTERQEYGAAALLSLPAVASALPNVAREVSAVLPG